MSLPIIDCSRSDSALQVGTALTAVGFMLVRNAGIDPLMLERVFAASRAFFMGPEAIKRSCGYRSAAENFGYQGMTEENLDPTAPADLKQTFTMRNIVGNPPPLERWPSAEFRELMQAFFGHALEAAYRLQRNVARALDLPEDFFTRCHGGENITLRLLDYPASEQAPLDARQLGAGAHTDYGLLTLLFQDTVGGLQVLDAQDRWQSVAPVPGTIVVNSGDMLERWSNGRYQSTLHRVQPVTGARDRFSIALFLDPDNDTLVEALPSCIASGASPRYPPITAREHLRQKLDASHKARFDR